MTDPKGDTHDGLVPEPGADLLAISLRSTGFAAHWAEASDGSRAWLTVPAVDERADPTTLRLGQDGQPLAWSMDTSRNELRLTVPLKVLQRYAGSVRRGSYVVVSDAQTYDLTGTSQAHSGGSIDLTTLGGARAWRVGDC